MHSALRLVPALLVTATALGLAACSEAPPALSVRRGPVTEDEVTSTGALSKKKAKDGDDVTTPRALGAQHTRVFYASHQTPKTRHAYGLILSEKGKKTPFRSSVHVQNQDGELPASVDLSDGAPVAGQQGQTGSCATWATGYSLMGWWANRIGLQGAPFAPMFLYSAQVRGDCNQGTSLPANFDLLANWGIPSASSYEPMQSNLDCATQPDQRSVNDAAAHRVLSYESVDLSNKSASIAQWLAAGFPVAIAMQCYNAIENVSADSFLIDRPQPGERSAGGHGVTAFGYDENGIWFMNSWGKEWGANGWAQISWDFVDGSHDGVDNINDAMVATDVQGWKH